MWTEVQEVLNRLVYEDAIRIGAGATSRAISYLLECRVLEPGPSGTSRRIRPNPLCEDCYTKAKAKHMRQVHNNFAKEHAARRAEVEAQAAARAAAFAVQNAERKAKAEAKAQAKAEAERVAAEATEAKASERAARGATLGEIAGDLSLEPQIEAYVRAFPSSRWAELVERLGARRGSPEVLAAKLLGLTWEDAEGVPLTLGWPSDIDDAPEDARIPDHFVCTRCERWADTVEAWKAKRAAIEAVGMSLDDWDRVLASSLSPAVLQRDFGMSYQAARTFLAAAERLGLLEAEKRGYSHVGARCSTCHGYRSEESLVWAPSLRAAIPAQLRFRVLQRDGFRCQYCGRSAHQGATLHLDHVVPYSAGGETTVDNLITACEQCNLGKSASTVVPD